MLEKCSVFEISVKLFRLKSKFASSEKHTNRFKRSAMSVHSKDAFRHATELVGTEIGSFCQHAQFYFAEKRGLS